jgi:hypothetical protein
MDYFTFLKQSKTWALSGHILALALKVRMVTYYNFSMVRKVWKNRYVYVGDP